MNTIQHKTIAIIGGGPGGLTLARLLQQNGVSVTVYERDANKWARAQGATLDLHEESGLLAIQVAGLAKAFENYYRPGADLLRVVDKTGTIVLDEHAREAHETHRPEIDRGPLQQLLQDSLAPGTLVWDRQLIRMTPQNEGWSLSFAKGENAYADLVIGADGANSKIRPYVTPLKPLYAGITIVEGVVCAAEANGTSLSELVKGGKVFVLGNDGKSLIISAKGDGSLVFYTGCRMPENWVKDSQIDFFNKEAVKTWFRETFADWDPGWVELIKMAKAPFIPRPQYYMPLDQDWATLATVTLLGDAAHLMPPYAGEGVNMAMLDALELSECLCNRAFTNTHSAIEAYERQMRKRAADVTSQTLESTAALHSNKAISFLMNMVS